MKTSSRLQNHIPPARGPTLSLPFWMYPKEALHHSTTTKYENEQSIRMLCSYAELLKCKRCQSCMSTGAE